MNRSKGFTLIELLVVITIIAILAIVIMIAYNRAKLAGQNAKRQEICRQIATAEELCYQEDDRYYTLDDLLDKGCMGGDPDTQRVVPDPDEPNARWDRTDAGGYVLINAQHDEFKCRTNVSFGNDTKWFCCTFTGCRIVGSKNDCKTNE